MNDMRKLMETAAHLDEVEGAGTGGPFRKQDPDHVNSKRAERGERHDALVRHFENKFPHISDTTFNNMLEYLLDNADHDVLFDYDWSSDLGGQYYVDSEYAQEMAEEALSKLGMRDDGLPDVSFV